MEVVVETASQDAGSVASGEIMVYFAASSQQPRIVLL